MITNQRDALRELLRRVDEVRGMADRSEARTAIAPEDHDALIETLHELVEELERSHRRLIETNVQLVSLREVASSMVSTLDTGETTRTVTRYLCQAFGFEQVFLLLVNREAGKLEGTWTRGGGRDQSVAVELPLLGDQGAIARALWLNRTVVHHAARHHPPALLPEGHPLQETLAHLGPVVCVPLQRSQSMLPAAETHELCGAHCVIGDATLLVPPPGPAADGWALEREERQAHCLACSFMPMLGVIGLARGAAPSGAAAPLAQGDVTLLESIALSVAPVVETARLTQELRRSERFREHVLDSMASALAAVNMKGEILTFNRAAESLLGWSEAEVLGQPFGQLFGIDGEALVHTTLEHGHEVLRHETLLRARDGVPVPVSLSTSLLRNERRAVYGAIATFVDLTPLKRAEEHARRLDRLAALGRFTSSVAHEIRNPLTGIAAGVQYLARTLADDAPQRESLAFILGEIQRLDRIVQDLFDITHPRGLQCRAAPVEDTVRRALQCLDALMAERGVAAAVDLSPRTPPVSHDPDQLEQVLINLLKNAVEASPSGATITVSLAPAAPPAPDPRFARGPRRARPATPPNGPAAPPGVVVRIEDQGHGISPEHLKTIFEPFFTTKPGGTGLGLYISHDIVKRHGGNLTVSSEPGRGTTFTVELPLENHGGNP
ncbi:MAG: PAS domain S-box protein [Candidatus Eisenbacteria bacterium]|nr:PAS domain S-box protein [Candidatus Eisenbacteria bacterium]